MGNELSTQVSNVNAAISSPVLALPYTNNFGINNGMAGSLFSAGFNGKNYSNDFMMPDFLKTGNITEEQRASIFGPMYTPPTQVQAPQTQQFVQYPQAQVPSQVQNISYNQPFAGQQLPQAPYDQNQAEQYYQELLAQNPNLRVTEKGNLYEESNSGKKTGIFAGLVAGLGGGILKVIKGGSLAKAFNIKSLAVKLPILAVAGWAAGSLIDSFTNSARKQQADCAV